MNMNEMKSPDIKGVTSFSLCDWPGRISAVIFLGGCNYRCPTCHNRELAFTPNECPSVSFHDACGQVENKLPWIDGITVTGGEPTVSPCLEDFLFRLKSRTHLPLKLDTNGSDPVTAIKLLESGLVETVACDIKGPFSKYPQLTGGRETPANAKENISAMIDFAEKRPGRVYFRTTQVPALTDNDIEAVKKMLPGLSQLIVQTYIPPDQ